MSLAALALVLAAVPPTPPPAQAGSSDVSVPYSRTVLPNGLQVIVHEDHSDPVVAVYVNYHVGSGREEPGRSGFAHLFEHMLFQGSQHVGDDLHFKHVSEAGGTLNGTTNEDRTLYYETLPSNQLELALWLEADRMGFLLPAVTQEKLDNQRDVVRNERRQNYENRPYGQVSGAIAAAMYPAGHPYSWLTIGSHEDLEAATLEDVHAFFRRWYGPNNATLAIGGDVDRDEVLALVETYFGPIPRGPEVQAPTPRPARLERSVRLVQEDDVQLPQLNVSWPGTHRYSEDDAALDLLAMVLSENKASILDRALTVDRVLAQGVSARNSSSEIAGTFDVSITAAPDVDLDTLESELHRLLGQLAETGVDPEQLQRMKNRYEADFVRRLETVSRKTSMLSEYNTFRGEPDSFGADLAAHLAVTPEDVRAVLRRYLVGRPAVTLSVVPEGELGLAASGRTPEQVAAEAAFDREAKPGAAPTPEFRSPAVWHATLANGVEVTGTPLAELPMTTLSLSIPGGRLRESPERLGISSLTAELMNEGTRELSTTELADALDFIGADLWVRADDDELTVGLSALDKHLSAAMELLADVLLEPRFDPADFERLKVQRLARIDTRGDNIRGIAGTAWDRLMYGEDTIAGLPSAGTHETVAALTLDDVKTFHRASLDPRRSRLVVASGLDASAVEDLFADVVARWQAPDSPVAAAKLGTPGEASARRGGARLFLIDKPGAAQSEVRIGHMSVASTDDDYWPLTVLNYVLGGSFSSRINMNLREDKGYTYGARSNFGGGLRPAPFVASAGVKTDVTAPSVQEFMKELTAILDGVTDEELAFAKSALTQAQLRQYESSRARLGLVDSISQYGWPDDYVEARLRRLEALTADELKALAAEHLHPGEMTILVVGDKETVLEGLQGLGLGPVSELDIDGEPLAGGS